jgi:hypothetical protein
MDTIFTTKFTYEKKTKESVVLKFSNKQGGDYFVFNYYWQSFAWAAIIGFIHDLRRPLQSPMADRDFSFNTMRNGGGEKIVEALICLCIAKSGTVDIFKEPSRVIEMINEYANGGFYYIMDKLDKEGMVNDFDWVKQEIFTRDIEHTETESEAHDIDALINDVNSDAFEAAMQDIQEVVPEKVAPIPTKRRWSINEISDLKNLYANGLSVDKIAKFLNRTEDDVNEQLNKIK